MEGEPFFKMEVGCSEECAKKLFRVHELKGGSDVALSTVIEEALNRGLDEMDWIYAREKDEEKDDSSDS